MKISRLELGDASDRFSLRIDRPAVGLNVITGGVRASSSGLAECMAHLLYGRRESSNTPSPGAMDIETHLGSYRLRRELQPDGQCRLTIAGLGPVAATRDTISQVLPACPPRVLSGLFYVNGREPSRVDWLLSEGVAATVSQFCGRTCDDPQSRLSRSELFAQRDEFARQVAQLLAERRRTSESIGRHLDDLARRRSELLVAIEQVRRELHAVEVELAQATASVRYRELESLADESARTADHPDGCSRIVDIDEQIHRWRSTLSDLQRRESQVRTELAQNRPVDSAHAMPLADQRAALAVTERLVADLQMEIARFARPVTSNVCACRGAHPRLQPLVAMLQQQVHRLVITTDEYERAVCSQALQQEAHHLARSQAELRVQLEHLLSERELLSRGARPRRWPTAHDAQASIPLRHFAAEMPELELKHHELLARLEKHRQQLRALDQRQEQAIAQRTTILSDRVLEQKQAELADIQRRLQPVRQPFHSLESSHHVRHGKRSSEYLAQFTDGEFIEMKLTPGGRHAVVVDRYARSHAVETLPLPEQHLVALSLSLAIIAGLSDSGVRLPVILDEPFAKLNDRQSAILAGVLNDFACDQLFVFTEQRAAIAHFRAWGASIHDLRTEPAAQARDRHTDKPAAQAGANLQISDPIERFPALGDETRDAFAPAGIHTVGDLLEADPARVAKHIADKKVTPAVVALWQSHAGLLCFVSGTTLNDAQVLTSVDIHSTRDLAKAKPRELRARIAAYLRSARGRRIVARGYEVTRQMVQMWIDTAKRAATTFAENPSWHTWHRHTTARQKLIRVKREASETPPTLRIKRASSKGKRRRSTPDQPPRFTFHLELTSPIADAPSITPAIAEQLTAAGIRQVRDLLATDADNLATRLADGGIAAADVAAWQHQARLCCRIPNLPAGEAALLAGAGFSTPEDVASMKPADLHGFIQSFSQMAAGRELLVDTSPPDLATVENWIRAARHSRSLGAA
jgi:hypothetical protein